MRLRITTRADHAEVDVESGLLGFDGLGTGYTGRHLDPLHVGAVFVHLEARDQVQDGATGLRRDHLAGAEGPTVAHPIDLEQHRRLLVAGSYEVRVQ